MEILRSHTPDYDAGKALENLLQRCEKLPMLLLLSGGSALSILQNVSTDFFTDNLTLSVLDERCSEDASVRNLTQLRETNFYQAAVVSGVKDISPQQKIGITCVNLQKQWEGDLRLWRSSYPKGTVVAIMGIGVDGHTAGMFAGEEDFSGLAWTHFYQLSKDINKYTKRITITHTFLREVVDEVIVFAVGEGKNKVLEKIQQEDDVVDTLPAAIFCQLTSVRIFSAYYV